MRRQHVSCAACHARIQGQLPIVVVEAIKRSRHVAILYGAQPLKVWQSLACAGTCATRAARLGGQSLIAIVEAMDQSTHEATLLCAQPLEY